VSSHSASLLFLNQATLTLVLSLVTERRPELLSDVYRIDYLSS
jgi:hypothetical protein